MRPDRVRALLVALALLSGASLAFLTFAPNRLVSGAPIGLAEALGLPAMPWPAMLCALAALPLLASPLLPPRAASHWLVIVAAGSFAGAVLWLLGSCAVSLSARGSASARTGLGAGCWLLLACVLLLAQDSTRRLRRSIRDSVLIGLALIGPMAVVISAGLVERLSLAREFVNQRDIFMESVFRHLQIVGVALAPTVLIGVLLGVAAYRRPRLGHVLYPVLNVVQTIPSIALFGLLIAPLSALGAVAPSLGISGVGLAPAVIALVLYSLLPIVRNTQAGLQGVPAAARDAAEGMGMTRRQLFWQVEAPLALPVFLAGLRITTVQAIGLAAVAGLIGAGGLGGIMFRGLFANAGDLVLLGALPIILLAVLVDFSLRLLSAAFSREATLAGSGT